MLLLTTQTPDRFEDRQVSFTRAVLFPALAPSESYLRIKTNVPRERIDEGRLADAGFTRHKHDLPLSTEHLLERTSHYGERFIASDKSDW